LSMQALTFVRSRLEEAKLGVDAPIGFASTQAVGEALPFAGNRFDCVLLSEVIEHLEAPQVSIGEAVRVLCPGGRLLITTPNYRSFWPLMEWTIDRLNMAPRMAGEQHISRFHLSSLKKMLAESGLEIEYAGSIYNLSPFISMVSAEQANLQLRRELRSRSALGMILVAVAVKH